MSLILYINGQLADLDTGQVIAQTKQVNDLNSLDDRQASYTNKFSLPKTATNLKIMQFLTLPGNNSLIPYQENKCSLYSDTGECFVFNGRAVITDGGDDFDVVVYDGIIDLYKAIENTPISAVGLQELDHVKSTAEIMTSWLLQDPPYRYILADYNGDTGTTNATPATVNVDYLVPSVSVKYLWEKVFAYYGFPYSGSVFDTEKFKNLWLTFPKGVSTGDNEISVFSNSLSTYESAYSGNNLYTYYTGYSEYEADDNVVLIQNRHLKVMEPGHYRLEVTGNLNSRTVLGMPKSAKVYVGKNSHYLPANAVQSIGHIKDHIQSQTDFSGQLTFSLNAYDSVCVMIAKATYATESNGFYLASPCTMNVTLVKINENEFSFSEVMGDFLIKDLLTEVVQRFGLTMFKDKYTNHYEFLTLQEQLQSPQVLDWSSKLTKKISENYIYGSYAQRNWLRYAYNDKESSHYDGYLDVQNVNLPPNKDVIKSKIYAPEATKSTYLSRQTNVYRLWDKEVVENPAEGDPPVKYKPLDKRYYFLRAEYSPKDVVLHSPKLGQTLPWFNCWIEQYWKLPFKDIVDDYYYPLRQLLEKSLVVNAELYLSETDVANFDFRKLIYIERLSSYFLMNKINNYIPGKPVKCELVRVHYTLEPQEAIPPVKITKVVVNAYNVLVHFDLDLMVNQATLQIYGYGSPGTWSNFPGSIASPRYQSFTPTGTFLIRMQAGSEYSNQVEITINGSSYEVDIP